VWLIIYPDNGEVTANTVYQVDEVKPQDSDYPAFKIKFWNGRVPCKESFDPENGALIPGDIDPTLHANLDERKSAAYATDGISDKMMLDALWRHVIEARQDDSEQVQARRVRIAEHETRRTRTINKTRREVKKVWQRQIRVSGPLT
jgi:hypothetical protein